MTQPGYSNQYKRHKHGDNSKIRGRPKWKWLPRVTAQLEVRVAVWFSGTFENRDVFEEPTGTYPRRVPENHTATRALAPNYPSNCIDIRSSASLSARYWVAFSRTRPASTSM